MRYHITFLYKDSFIFYLYKPVITAKTYMEKTFPDMVVDKNQEKYVNSFIDSLKDNVFPVHLYTRKPVFVFPSYSLTKEIEYYMSFLILNKVQNRKKIEFPLSQNLSCFKELNILVYIDAYHWNIPGRLSDIKKMMHIVKYPGIKRFQLDIKRNGIYNTLSYNGTTLKPQDVMRLSKMAFGDISRFLFTQNNGVSKINIDTTKYIKDKHKSVSGILNPYIPNPNIELIF